MTEMLNDKVLCSEQDDDDDDDGVPPLTLPECQSYFKRIRYFPLAQNHSADASDMKSLNIRTWPL